VAAEWTPFEMCQRRGVDGVVHLRLLGELDLAVADQLSARFRQLKRAGCRVRLDLSQLGFIDRCGLLAVLCAISDAQGGGWELVVDCEVSTSVQRLIEFVGVSSELWPGTDRSQPPAHAPITETLLERTARLLRARSSE
jgi:anti-anti-sigma factor